MKFGYKARTKDGQLQVGNVEAPDREAAADILSGHNLFVLSIEPIIKERWYNRIANFLKRVKSADLMIFTRQLATLLGSQVPLSDSLSNLYKQTKNPTLKEVIAEIISDVDSGYSLSQALGRHKGIFSEFYVNMVKSAEVTGRLNEVLEYLADYLEKQAVLVSKVKNALTYPIFVIILFFIVTGVMVTVVLPQITSIFADTDVKLPVYTRMVLSVGDFAQEWWWAVLIIMAVVAMTLINYFQTEEGKIVADELLLRSPLIGPLFQKLYVARFAESTRVLIKGGLTIPQAIEISSHTIGNSVYKNLLSRAADQIRKGKRLSRAIATMPEFPPLVVQMISVGESTGKLEQLLSKITSFYSRQVEDTVNNLTSLIQPALMIVIGVMVAFLFASILMPLYNMSQLF